MSNGIKFFKSQNAFEQWLKRNHERESEIWIGFYKKNSAKKGITPFEALDAALCFGWIDGIRQSVDDISYMNRYTPRTARSKWSKINTIKVSELIKAGKMKPPGLKAIEEAKADGRWSQAYDSPKSAVIPAEFMKLLRRNKEASAQFKKLSKQSLYTNAYRIQNAKRQETKVKWMERFVEMLATGEEIRL